MLLLTVITAAPLVPVVAAAVDSSGSPPITENTLTMFVGAVVTACTLTAVVTIFVLNKLSKNRGLTYQVRDQILKAINTQAEEFRRWMTRHERGDDDRFDIVHREIYALALRNAIKDNKSPPVFQPLPRRRSFDDEQLRDDPMRYASDIRLSGMTGMVPIDEAPRPDAIMPNDEAAE